METKECFACHQVKPLDDFYAHPAMADGRLGKCKACAKAHVKANRSKRAVQYAAYEAERFKNPGRKAQVRKAALAHRKRSPEKYRARNAINNAVRDGRLEKPKCCQRCGKARRLQAHHADYSKPLDVTWVCFKCHREEHGQVVLTVEPRLGGGR